MKRASGYQRRSGRGSASGRSGQVRIIAGRFGGRRIRFPAARGLRPTPERTRETLFNWLQGALEGARVLDLFAGSGALAFEALSRGAREAVLIERDGAVAKGLREAATALGAADAHVVSGDALAWLGRTAAASTNASGRCTYDLVFCDPPFDTTLAASALSALRRSALLAPTARIYVEWSNNAPPPFDEIAWEILRTTAAGESHAALLCQQRPCAQATAV
jgi:16S rRNA (guanine966-N2)-methyltransferase